MNAGSPTIRGVLSGRATSADHPGENRNDIDSTTQDCGVRSITVSWMPHARRAMRDGTNRYY